jgi:hypothetical protein
MLIITSLHNLSSNTGSQHKSTFNIFFAPYRAILVMQGVNHVVLMDTTCDYSVTGRWNIVNLAISDANVVRGGAGEATQSLVL